MSEVDEDEANRMAEEERLRRENALLDEEEPMEEDDDRQVQKVRLEEIEKAINDTCTEIKNQTRFSMKQCRVLLAPLISKTLEVEEQFRGKNSESKMLQAMNAKLNNTVLTLQNQLEAQSHHQLPATNNNSTTTDMVSGQTSEVNEERTKMVSLLEANEILTEEALNELLEKIEQTRNELKTQEELLQKARSQSDKVRREYLLAKEQVVTLQLKLRAEQEKTEKLERENSTVAANTQSNSLSRYGEQRQNSTEKNKNIVQTTERQSMCATSTPRRGMLQPGKIHEKVGEPKESTRYYNADTSEIIETMHESIDADRNCNQRIVEQDVQRNMIVHNGHEMNMNMQWRMTQALPDPPVFSAGKNSVTAETFERAFYMKYRFFDIDAQKSFLETRFLAGNALTVYKGLPESEKYSVSRILDAIRRRLSQSEPEESRRAKSKFQALKLQKEQSIQNFCLHMDEIVRVGYKGVPESQISSMKTTKLLDEMKEHAIFDVALQILGSQLRKCPELEQYELCREEATRFDEDWRSGKGKATQNEKKMSWQQPNQKFSNQQSNYSNQHTPTTSRNKPSTGNSEGSQNWRERSQGNFVPSNNSSSSNSGNNNSANNSVGFRECSECRLTGCHEPKCSRAPGSNTPRKINPIVCFRCNEQGHIAPNCPQKIAQQNIQTDVAKVQTLDKKEWLEIPEDQKSKQDKINRTPVRIEQGRIGSAEVSFVIDSGACISVIAEKTWKDIVQKNGGEEWEKEAILKNPEKIDVYAANNTPVNLLYQVKVETSLHSRTRMLKFYVTDIDRDTVILGIDQFETLGIQMSFQTRPRDIRMVKQIRLAPGNEKIVEVSVEGTVRKDKSLCLITPKVPCLAPAIYQISKSGKARVQLTNFGKKSIFLKKGELIASGEVEGFDVIEKNEENMKLLEEFVERSKLLEKNMESINLIDTDDNSGERWKILCEQLKRTSAKSEEEEEVWKVIKDYQHIFATDDTELGRTNVVECEIELTEGAEPVRQKARPIPLAIRGEIRKMIQKMLSQRVIRESKSPWASPVVLVKKKDGSVRMCIDYRKVNLLIKYNAHPLPNIEATLLSLSGKKVFTTFDLLAGYWQLPLKEESKEITAFAIGSELFEWNVLPFGLATSPAIFQAAMECVVGDLLGTCVFVYVDDLLIASENLEEHAIHVQTILERIEKSGMKLKASKCWIARDEVDYLGHMITPEGVKTEEAKVEKMKQFARPVDVKQLQSFLGLVGYYRNFIMNYSKIAFPLNSLTSKKNAWIWDTEQENAFVQLKSSVCSAPVLRQPDPEAAISGDRPYLIYTDASRQGVGAVLAQEANDGEQHPIAFASKSLTPAETRYHITDLEALAMMFALRRFRTIIYGSQVIVFTDHKPLISLMRGSRLADRLMRWSIELIEFNPKIVYVKGKANVVADALSRGGCPLIDQDDMETGDMPNIIGEVKMIETGDKWNTSEWLEKLRKEDEWNEVIRRLEKGEKAGIVKIDGVRKKILLDNYMIIGRTLRNTEDENCNRLVVPEEIIPSLIKEAHEGALAGHFGTEKMLRQLNKKFFWLRMRARIENHVKSCQKCLCTNDYTKMIAPLTPYRTEYPLQIVACDLIDVGLSTQGNRYILLIIDLFTKYGIGVPIPDKKGVTVLKAFIERWAIGEGRVPEILLTDQGKEFCNEHFQKFAEIVQMKHITTKGYNSRANGCVERFNKTLMHTIKKQNAVAAEWDDQVPFAVYAYNSVGHRTTGESPMFLMYGRDPKGGLEKIGDDAVGVSYVDMDEYKNLLVQELNKAYAFVKEHALQEQNEHKALFDEKHCANQKSYPRPGARVLVEVPSEKMGARYPKLTNKWKGPYRVISCSNNSAILVPVTGSNREMLKVPFENLRNIPHQMDDTPIETKKGRARLRNIAVEEIAEKIVDEGDHDINIFSELYWRRCQKPCIFFLPNHKELRFQSPTQFARAMQLLKKHKELNKNDVMMLVQKRIPMLSELPTDEAWLILAQCPTLNLWVKEVHSWKETFDLQYAVTLQNCLGQDLLNAMEAMVFAFPGVDLRSVALVLKHVKLLKGEDTVVERIKKNLETRKVNVAVFIIPFSTSEQSKEAWQNSIDAIPKDIDLIVVFSHISQFDHSEGEVFVHLVKELYRLDGKITVLGPDFIVQFNLNRTLLNVADRSTCLKYWETVERIVKEGKIMWPHLKLDTTEPAVTPSETNTAESESSRGAGGPMRSQDTYRGRGNGPYTKFKNHR